MLKDESFKKNYKFLTYLFIFLFLFFAFFLASCSLLKYAGIGNVVSEDRPVSGIKSISAGSSINLIIEQAETEALRVEAVESLIPNIASEVVNGELQISLKGVNFANIRPVNCYVTVKDLNQIKVSSSASVNCDMLKTENLSIEMASSSKGFLNLDVASLDLSLASSANLTLSGKAESQTIRVSSSGKLDAFNLICRNCEIEVSSSGNASINVSENLDAEVKSSAKLSYKGNPKVSSDVSSGGILNKVSN